MFRTSLTRIGKKMRPQDGLVCVKQETFIGRMRKVGCRCEAAVCMLRAAASEFVHAVPPNEYALSTICGTRIGDTKDAA